MCFSRNLRDCTRRLKPLGNLKPKGDTLPLDFRLLEIDEKTKAPAGGAQVVQTLRSVLVAEALHTFQLHHELVFDEKIGKILSHRLALVADGK